MDDRIFVRHPKTSESVNVNDFGAFAAFVRTGNDIREISAALTPRQDGGGAIPPVAVYCLRPSQRSEFLEWTIIFADVPTALYDLRVFGKADDDVEIETTEPNIDIVHAFIDITYPPTPITISGTTVGAYGTIGGGHTASSVKLTSSTNELSPTQLTNNTSIGLWTASFTDVPPDTYHLIAIDSGSHRAESGNITVTAALAERTRRERLEVPAGR